MRTADVVLARVAAAAAAAVGCWRGASDVWWLVMFSGTGHNCLAG
jgi:hypothetical protein